MRTLLTGAAVSALVLNMGATAMAFEAGDLPPNAVPGHCYGKVLLPEQYESYTEQVLENAARTELRIIPAITTDSEQRVVATESYTQYETIPATYRTVTETVVIRPATVRRVTVPAVMGTETEQVLVREAHTVWKRGAPGPADVVVPGSQKMYSTGEVICLVQIPAEYRTITRTVVRQAETTREVAVPAETTTVTRQVIDQPARVIEHVVPATYKTVRVTTVSTPERTETITIPATYRSVTKQRIVSQSRFDWKEVNCQPEGGAPSSVGLGYGPPSALPPPPPPPPPLQRQSYTTSSSSSSYSSSYSASSSTSGDSTVRALQSALGGKGYYKGPVNGLFTAATQDSMVRYQRDSHLAVGRLTPETARALGI